MVNFKTMELWFATGSQHLYGDQTLRTVAAHANEIAGELASCANIPLGVIAKPVLTTPDAITQLCTEANGSRDCVGIIVWMHTFSPAKMWLSGLRILVRPILHLHTQFNRDLPWDLIDMDFMNLNQSARGDREFGYMATRLGINRKVAVGHWRDETVQERIGTWSRAAAAWSDSQRLKIARFGDNMREVAVTEGDKVEAQARFGYSVNGFGVGDSVCTVNRVSDAEVDRLVAEYDERYVMAECLRSGGVRRAALREAAAIELGIRRVPGERWFPRIQRYVPGSAWVGTATRYRGAAADGGWLRVRRREHWKTAALVRAMKVMRAHVGSVSVDRGGDA